MKIGIDIRCLSEGRRTGVEEYTINLLKELFKEDRQNKYVLFLNSWEKPTIDLSWAEKYKNVEVKIFRWPNKVLNLFFWYLQYPKLDKILGNVDVIFMPNINFVAISKKVKLILTIHDLSFENWAETLSLKRRIWHFFVNPRALVRRANKVIAVSESTKRDLVKLYRASKEKIEVVYNGVPDQFRKINRNDIKLLKVKEKYNLPFNFILFLGTFEPRKNIIGVIRAYESLRQQENKQLNKFKLVIAGSSGWRSKKVEEVVNNSKYKQDILRCKFIENQDKVYIYNLASVFVFPSFFEGFGIPPLEAMKCGCPVVVANNTSLVEVVSMGGIVVDADKPNEIAMVCKEFLLNKKAVKVSLALQFKQAQKFSWAKSAEKLKNIFLKT